MATGLHHYVMTVYAPYRHIHLLLSTEIPEFGEGVQSVLGIRSQGLWLQLMCCALANCLSSISEVRSISPESKGVKFGWCARHSSGQEVQTNLGRK
jgi:hypothetical protein